jgi:hypothetical protein
MIVSRRIVVAMPGKSCILLMMAVPCLGLGCKPSSNEMKKGDSPLSIELTSTAFQTGETIPKQYTGDGVDQSPPLRWSEPPSGVVRSRRRPGCAGSP